jgi:NAD(P)-dependent dehydrogenase (short-subunit alcohol dehydrogenase family)
MAARLEGKTIVVTGGESGIGRAIALRCASDGAKIGIVGIDGGAADAVADEIRSGGGVAAAVQTDVRDQASVERALDLVTETFGRLDAVVANAGVSQTKAAFVDLELAEWQRMLAVNLTGTFLTLQAGARVLVRQGEGGCLIATGSSTVFRPHGGREIGYVAAKGAIHTMIRALAFELAPNRIRVNAIAPGMTDTPMARVSPGHIEAGLKLVPMGELIPPTELGALAAFMVSDDAAHMSGSIVQLDAARTSD